jgi:ATP-binding cassette subfamily B protein
MLPADAKNFASAYKMDEADDGGRIYRVSNAVDPYAANTPAGEAYKGALSYLMSKVTSLSRAMGQQTESGSASGTTTEITPEQFYAFVSLIVSNPNLEQELQAAQNTRTDDLFGAQVATAMVQFFYAEAGVDTEAIQKAYILRSGVQMLLFALGIGLASVMVGFLAARVSTGVARDLRHAVFQKVQRFSKAEIDQFSTASLITRSTNDVQQVQMMVHMGLRILCFAPVMGVGGLIMALRKSPGLSWIIGLAGLLLAVTMVLMLVFVLPRFKKLQGLIDRLNLVSRENLTGLMVIRAFGNEKHETDRFETAAHDLARTERFVNRSMAALFPMLMFLMSALNMMILWFGGKAIEASTLQIGDMLAFVQYAMHIVMSFLFVAMMFVMLPRAAVSANRIREVLETEVTVNDCDTPRELPQGDATIVFDHVRFRYKSAEEDVLSDITFTARPAQTTAFIGATGAGKTTLVNLLERFYDVTDGKITYNGVDIRALKIAQLRRAIGFVPQRAVLFSGDIFRNVTMGADADITEKAVHQVIEVAQAADFVAETPDGLRGSIAQGGSNVSGGQKQRLSIARALARKPKVYVFDDSFSALDFKTDAALRRALKASTGNATVFIVAQRVSTILHAEQIVVLDEGRIAGIGTHAQLMQSCGVYREIAESQLSKEEL